jgi:formate dehydrogenase subunit gamma
VIVMSFSQRGKDFLHVSFVVLAILLMLAPLRAAAEQGQAVSPIMVPNPATDLWRAVRQREGMGGGDSQVRGVETGVLIQKSGEDWRNYRRQDFIGSAALLIAAAAGGIALFYLIRGRIRIPDGRSGRRIKRFADIDRIVHWVTAILFIFLGLTGLTLLFGRFVILPVLGPEAFSVIASACKEGHNLFGPLFLVALALLFARFAAKNLWARGDLNWLAKGGGIIGTGHVSAGYFNAGEKIWFWLVMLLGIVVSISGLVLLFPVFGQGREIMQLALVIHGIGAVLFIAGSFGHIYIGTAGTEGSLESMTTGYVDENWAKAHHDRWYGEVIGRPVGQGYDSSKITAGTLQSSLHKM